MTVACEFGTQAALPLYYTAYAKAFKLGPDDEKKQLYLGNEQTQGREGGKMMTWCGDMSD